MGLDFEKIKQAAEGYRADMTAFLRAMISHPSESCEEKEVVARDRLDGRRRQDHRNRLSHRYCWYR